MTSTCWIVDAEVGADHALTCADQVRQWLLHEGIVLPTPPQPTDIFPVDSPHYPRHLLAPGPTAKDWSRYSGHIFLLFSGLEIVTEKRVFDPGANFSDLIECPHCLARHDSSTLEWMVAIDGWWSRATLNKPPISAMPPVAFRDAHALMVFEGKSGGIDPHCMAAAHAARHAGALMP